MATYTIKKGDTLSKIAKANGTTVANLAQLNGIKNVNSIKAGATIKLSADEAPAASSASPASSAAPAADTTAPAAYSMPTDAQIRQEAESAVNPGYQQALDILNQQGTDLTTRYNRSKEDFSKYVDNALKTTQQNVEDSMLKRGMGRSTQATHELTEGLADVNAKAQETYDEMAQDYATNMGSIDTQRLTLANTKEQNIQSRILELQNRYEQIRQFNEQLAEQRRQFDATLANKSSGGGGGGGGGLTLAEVLAAIGAGSGTGGTTSSIDQQIRQSYANRPASQKASSKRNIYDPKNDRRR